MNVNYFKFEEGLDKEMCELLNAKVKLVEADFNRKLSDQQTVIKYLHEQISKYKRLVPKSN